jgi:ligand-binding sensor domain-containing protein
MKIGGISLWNRHDNKWQYYEARMLSSLSRDEVHAITGNYDFIAFATDLGVAIYQPERDRWQTLSVLDGLEGNMINDVLADDKYLYTASEYGFNWIDPENKRVYNLTGSVLDNVAVNQLAIDDSSLIWAATRFGLYSISITSGEAEFHTSRATVSDYNLTAVEAVGREIWFAGSYGISYWQRDTDEWHSFPALEINTDYRDIGVTKNFIWFATDKGLLKYDRKRDYWRMYTEADGMISRDTYHIEVEGNYLWLSTARGITKFRWKRKGRLD